MQGATHNPKYAATPEPEEAECLLSASSPSCQYFTRSSALFLCLVDAGVREARAELQPGGAALSSLAVVEDDLTPRPLDRVPERLPLFLGLVLRWPCLRLLLLLRLVLRLLCL